MDIIYKINFTDNRCYIGKLDNTNVISAHTKWYPQMSGQVQSTWEHTWISEVKQTGLANQNFIYSYQYWSVEEVKNNIIKSGLSENAFNALKKAWGKEDKETCEALCIILAKKDNRSIGQQIDFLSDQTNAKDYVSQEEFERRMKAQFDEYKLISGLYLNFSKRKAPVINEITEELEKLLVNATNSKGAVWLTKSKKLAQAITLKITENTVKDLVKQLERRAEKEPFLKGYIEGIAEQLENTATKNGKTRSISYGTLFKSLYSYIDDNNAGQFELLKEAADPEKLSALLQGWLDKTFLSTVLPQRTGNYYTFLNSPELPKLKKLFSKYIADICFKDGINGSYQDWKEDHQTGMDEDENEYIHSSRPGSYYPAYLKSIGEKWDGLSLREKLEGKIDNLNFPFIHNSWYNIYQEQVACFLTANGITFKKSGLNNFINIMTPDQINYF